jgi:hypothetical protein
VDTELQRFSWGITRYDARPPVFPQDTDAVASAAWEAIAATLYGQQKMDPNEANNARAKNIYSHRPTRKAADRGRIGIEIDGARHLFPSRAISDGNSMRHISLKLAGMIAQGPWKGYENSSEEFNRPVAVYFNTIKQSLVACHELALLKRLSDGGGGIYESILIKTLGQDVEIPKQLCKEGKTTRGLNKGNVKPEKGIIMIVQPTDFNEEFRPPGPSIDSVFHLQQLVARAAFQSIPVVVISPRFLVRQSSCAANWDQSGFQQSSVYGGNEPPLGPTPWILRDFLPPSFVWVGSALELAGRRGRQDVAAEVPVFSRVSMTQSVVNEAHAWHIFGVEDSKHTTCYRYLASTDTSAGRPTQSVIKCIHDEWS